MESVNTLNHAQIHVLRLLSKMKTEKEVNELRDVISSYYAKKATEAMDKLWASGDWSAERNEAILTEHLRTPYRHAE